MDVRHAPARHPTRMRTILVGLVGASLFSYVPDAAATSYSYYFADDGQGSKCSMQSPCASLSDARNKIKAAGPNDIVQLLFKRGDIWRFDTAAVVKRIVHGLTVYADDPTVHIDAYGSGDKPVFDGMVSDWKTVPSHNLTTGPLRWNTIFQIGRENCSLKNIEIRNVYGHGISLHENHDGATISNCDIHHFGASSIKTRHSGQNVTVEHCLVHTGQLLFQYDKMNGVGWGGGITLKSNSGPPPSGNIVRYNVVYDIMGEGINTANSIVEYNVVGDTYSIGICTVPHAWDFGVNIVRYNLVTMSDWSASIYDDFKSTSSGSSGPHGLRVFDEEVGVGNNLSCDVQYYGNVIINRGVGIWLFNPQGNAGDTFGPIKVFNNTIIDSHADNIRINNLDQFTDVKIYNNASVLLDRTGAKHVQDFANKSYHAGWTIENNAFWTKGGSPIVDANWRAGFITADPKLAGEPAIDWDGQRGAEYYFGIAVADVNPLTGSSWIDSGKALAGYETTFMTAGSNFSALPDSATVVLAEQDSSGSGWEVGALVHAKTPADAGPHDAAVADAGVSDAAVTADAQTDPDARPAADGRPEMGSDAAFDAATGPDGPSSNAATGLDGGCALAPSPAVPWTPVVLVLLVLLFVARPD